MKKIKYLSLFFVFFLLTLLLARKYTLVTADLGRHLKNGEIILQEKNFSVLYKNFYSYVNPDFPFINHHWLSGVVFFLVKQFLGFTGLSFFFVLANLITLFLFFDLARRKTSWGTAIVISLITLPLLVSRSEIRPEVFSSLFSGLFLWILIGTRDGWLTKRWRWLLPILEVIWINLHVYFFLGFFIILVFFFEELIKKERKVKNLLDLVILGIITGITGLINPAGIKGLLYPLRIFEGYGYRLFENQSVWFLDKIVGYPPNLYFKIAFGILVISWVYVFIKRKKIMIGNLLFTFFFSYLGWTAVRNFALFGFFALMIIGENCEDKENQERQEDPNKETVKNFAWLSLAVFVLFIFFLLNPSYWISRVKPGLGLEKGDPKAAEFYLKEGLKEPIFNNYDNGGYLIYYLYPEKIFVDNRPEAYPAKFFDEIYIPMQEKKDQWEQKDKKYNFNTIFFYRNDLTSWGQNFLVERIKDSSWAPVYVDEDSIIFVKRNGENKKIIQNFELPKEMFSLTK
ncbi:MAG: hypothetical protein M1514_02705 [Patescibacteria group bacterium]|nr:hypothetical protein [Patescibacteria group bacterium]